MDLAQLELEQRLEIAQLLRLGEEEATFYAQNPGLLQGALQNVFHNNGSYAEPVAGEDVLDPESATPRSEWADMARRAIARTPAADDSAILLQAIGATLYERPFTVDAEITDEEIAFLQGILADFDAGLTVSESVSQFNAAATAAAQAAALEAAAAAEAAAAEWSAAQGEMQVLAQLAALGYIDPSEIAGGFQPEHAEILQDIIDSNNTFRMMPPAGASAGAFVQGLYQRTFDGDGNLRVAGGIEVLSHYTDGLDHSAIIQSALTSGDPAQVQMAQGLIGAEIDADGEWTLDSLDAARAYLEAPQAGGVPDSLYSEQFGVAATGHITSALRDGSMNMPSAADLDRIGASFDIENLSSAPLSIQASTVATWLSDPDNHEAYAEMVATQELTEAEVNALAAARTVVEARIEAETAVETTINDGIDAVTPVLDLPAAEINMTAVDTALLNAETALRTGDLDTASAELQTYLVEAEAAVVSAEMTFVHNHEGAFATAAHFLQDENPEVSAILTSGDPEAIREFLVSHDTTELQQIFYNSNTNLGASFGTNAMGSGWQRVIDARRDLADIRAQIEGTAPAETAPEIAPETPVETTDPTAYLSSLEEHGLMGEGVLLPRAEVDPADSMAELQAYLAGIDPADRIALDNAEAEQLAAPGAPLTGTEPTIVIGESALPFNGAGEVAAAEAVRIAEVRATPTPTAF